MKVFPLCLASIFVLLAGCATTRPAPPVGPSASEQYVDGAMEPVIRSIDASLKTIVVLSRGDEAPRKPGAIGDTVAGGQPPRDSLAMQVPVPAARVSVPTAPDGGAAAARLNAGRSALATRMRLEWSGPIRGFLDEVGKAIGYTTEIPASLGKLNVSLKFADISAQDLLVHAADQVTTKADLRIDTETRTIRLTPR